MNWIDPLDSVFIVVYIVLIGFKDYKFVSWLWEPNFYGHWPLISNRWHNQLNNIHPDRWFSMFDCRFETGQENEEISWMFRTHQAQRTSRPFDSVCCYMNNKIPIWLSFYSDGLKVQALWSIKTCNGLSSWLMVKNWNVQQPPTLMFWLGISKKGKLLGDKIGLFLFM